MSRQKSKREPKKSQARASPSSFSPQLKSLFLRSKIHTVNSIGEIIRVERFRNGNLEKQYAGLLVNALIRKTPRYVHLTLINGGKGLDKIKIPLEEFGDESKTRIIRLRALIEESSFQQFIPVDKEENFTLNPEIVRKIVKISTEELKKLLLEKEEY